MNRAEQPAFGSHDSPESGPSPVNPLLVAVGLVAFVALTRVVPHAPNVAAVAAAALFAGWYFRSRLLALAVPVTAMLLSDTVIGGHHPAVMVIVYASLAAPVLFRGLMGNGRSLGRLFGGAAVGALAGSTLFFLTTNFAVWAFGAGYPRTAGGLGQCYINAIPFYRMTALGDLAFAMVLFGAWALVTRAAGAVENRRPVAA